MDTLNNNSLKLIHPCLLKSTGNIISCEKARSEDGKKSVEQYSASKWLAMLSIGDVEKLVKKRKTED